MPIFFPLTYDHHHQHEHHHHQHHQHQETNENGVRLTSNDPSAEQPILSMSAEQYAHLPKALPCADYYNLYPERVGPTGTVIISSAEEMELWALVATPITEAEALQMDGGCIQYVTGDSEHPVQYYRFEVSSDSVFGRAAYLRPSAAASSAALSAKSG